MDVTTLLHDSRGWSLARLPVELDSPRTLIVCFAAPSYADAPGPIAELRDAFPQSTIIGCSTAGEIQGATLHDGALSVAIARFASTTIAADATSVPSMGHSEEAGRRLGQRLRRREPSAVFVLADGLSVNGSALLRGLRSGLPPDTLITGGLAADGPDFGRTWVLRDGAPAVCVVTAVALTGERLEVGYGSRGGWDIFGPERVVTRSVGNVLHELDGRPALDLYCDYLGDLSSELPGSALRFPLSLRAAQGEEPFVRTVLAVDGEARTMTFAGDVPQGHLAQLMRANMDRLVAGAGEAAGSASTMHDSGDPVLSIAISCVGRRLVLGERTEEEIEAGFSELPTGSSQVGFYSYGEICPNGVLTCDLQNQTMTMTTLRERPA